MGWCTVPWSRSILKMAMLGQLCVFHGTLKFSMIGLCQEDEIEEIILWPEIWWHDAVYHEMDHRTTLQWHHNGHDGISNHCQIKSLAFVLGIHRWPVNSPHQWPVTRKMFPFDDIMKWPHSTNVRIFWSHPAEGAIILWTSCKIWMHDFYDIDRLSCN